MSSRWADTEADRAEEVRRKKEKEEKKRLKLQKQKEAEEAAARAKAQQEEDARPSKKRKLSPAGEGGSKNATEERKLMRFDAGGWGPCRHLSNFEIVNEIAEGTYGHVSRARELATGAVFALKKVKMDFAVEGFPVPALREIALLQKARHKNIVDLREIVLGESFDEVVLVLEFIEHDLRTLQDDMPEPFLPSEVKALLLQLTSALSFLHENHIMHRDLKTANILLSNRGVLKLADFGMARFIPPPSAPLTQYVVTLWYRAPELLLGALSYSTEVDMWSLGCIFGELLLKQPLLEAKNEVDQLSKIFALCGLPNDKSWPGFWRLPNSKSLKLPRNAPTDNGSAIRAKFPIAGKAGAELLISLLSLNPDDRPSARAVLEHQYFKEQPKPKPASMFPTFPSVAGQENRKRRDTPNAPRRGDVPRLGGGGIDFSGLFAGRDEEQKGAGFMLRMG
ncbi:serine/threonine protein kinase, CMGC family, CDC2/CDK subfamily [Amniculicola lignicola CBS 123094]|uniref:cyclin-dependent kinase n=1 Tax=Amniculicola lignicola CBS 123094 TaxID=1392246 RepID=A0A6A5WKJ0_9PLEO|nr:serine/threonine protein kinase, CMGC family, CDC2/CDK subfamily [Amniculicola lignicola CBS 123094]